MTLPSQPESPEKTYRCGTLAYTKAGLISLFAWLLWGDFCYILMEAVVPAAIPLKLQALKAPNWVIGMIITVMPNLLNMTISPFIGVKSDNCRSRWGRRIPFILGTLPFLCLALILLGFSENISEYLQQAMPMLANVAPATVTILVIGVLMVIFQFFNLFVNTLFNCLFNDVVPANQLGRFAGWFRVVGTGSSALFNWFAYKYAYTHMQEVFLGAAVLYFVGFGLMCLRVKEGKYPPVDPEKQKAMTGVYGIKTYFKESFSHGFYWFLFISAAILAMAAAAWGFQVFFYLEMGMSLEEIGRLNAISMVISVVATLFAAKFVDSWHPLRVYAYTCMVMVIGPIMNWIWIFISLPGSYFFYLTLASVLLYVFLNALTAASALPMLMRLFPHSRYAQFCSAQGIIRSFCIIIAGMVFGGFLDLIRYLTPEYGENFCYRFNFCWSGFCCFINCAAVVWGYRMWNKMGGDLHFNPPAPWEEKGYEEIEAVPSTGLNPKLLGWSLRMGDALMIISLVIPILMLPFLQGKWPVGLFSLPEGDFWPTITAQYFDFASATRWFYVAIIPASLLALVIWLAVAKGIRRDIKRILSGQALINGLPHHGLMLIIVIKFLLAMGLWVAQLYVAMEAQSDRYIIVFALGNIVTNFLLILCIWILTKVEKGFTLPLQEKFIRNQQPAVEM